MRAFLVRSHVRDDGVDDDTVQLCSLLVGIQLDQRRVLRCWCPVRDFSAS